MTTKVFVGNLAFPTTDQALAEAFQDCGLVKSGVVITRGRRSLGYGFVEFETPEAAKQAVDSKNNSDFKGRIIKVELASDNPVRVERPPKTSVSASAPAGKKYTTRGGENTRGDNSRGENTRGDNNRGENTRGNRRDTSRGDTTGGDTNASSNADTGAAPRRRRNRRRRVVKSAPAGTADQDNSITQSGEKPARGGPRRNRRTRNNKQNKDDRALSSTAVFVANLPFSVDDEQLKTFFQEHNPSAAHVVVTRNGRSRGYGFVEFTSEKDQQDSITVKNGQLFNDRKITVTASYQTQEAPATTEQVV